MTRFLAGYPEDLAEWEGDERLVSRGFTHPWRSEVAAANGEAFFDALARDSLRADATVLDVGCGHGAYAMSLATECARVIGLDRDDRVLGLARELAAERDVRNVEFVLGEPVPDDLPIADRSVDLFVCRRGPVIGKWLPLASRVAKPGAYAIGMHPTGAAGAVPDWNAELPEPLRIERVFGYDEVREWVTTGLTGTSATLHSCWWFDVPETFDDPEQLYAKLAGARVATPYEVFKKELTALLERRGGRVELRHARLVWRVDLGIE